MFKNVFSLHSAFFTQPAFYLISVCSLHFTPGPQSAVCSPQSAFYTDRFFDGFPLYRTVKALHFQAIMTSPDKVVWLGVTVRLLIPQWCNIRKSSVYLLLNMHIIISSWRMLYFQCLIIRFYRFSLILPKRRKITWVHTSCRCLSEISSHVGAFGV